MIILKEEEAQLEFIRNTNLNSNMIILKGNNQIQLCNL